jgi:hypothetical protein
MGSSFTETTARTVIACVTRKQHFLNHAEI